MTFNNDSIKDKYGNYYTQITEYFKEYSQDKLKQLYDNKTKNNKHNICIYINDLLYVITGDMYDIIITSTYEYNEYYCPLIIETTIKIDVLIE